MPECPSRLPRLLAALCLLASPLAGCATGDGGSTPTTQAASSTGATASWPTAAGRLTDDQSRAVFERAAAAITAQKTMAVNFVVERTDGYCINQILNPTVRLDLRDPDKPVASLALSILASNVAVGGKVYRQQPDPSGSSTVWVVDPEAKTPLEFVLWKPGAPTAAVAALGTEQVAGQQARHYRVFDPTTYGGPTTAPASPTPATPQTPCRTASPAPTGTTRPAAPTPSAATTPPAATTPLAGSGIGDYDDVWLAPDGTPVRLVSVLGELRLTSTTITYGGDVHVEVPDVSKAITPEEYDRRQATASPSPTAPG